MASRQPGAVLNLVLFCFLGGVGWFAATWTKPAKVEKTDASEISASGPSYQPGVLLYNARQLTAAASPGAKEFDELVARYGSGTQELEILAAGLFEKWAAQNPAEASTAGITRCLAHTPDLLPALFAKLGSAPTLTASALYAALPATALRQECLTGLAASRGTAGLEPDLSDPALKFSRGERSVILREWHRARALVDAAAAEKSVTALTDPDDVEAARSGILYARATTSPDLTLRASLTRFDFNAIAAAAFESWIPRDSPSAWAFATTLKGDPRLPVIAAHMLTIENRRRRFSDNVPEMSSLLDRLFPDELPAEVLAVFIPALAAEQPATAQRFADGVKGPHKDDASVILFDAYCQCDPPSAWRLAAALVQKDGATDHRATNTWTSAIARSTATPQERLAAGFPDLTDMLQLAHAWLDIDPPAALAAYCSPVVPGALQKVIIETAISPHANAIPPQQLLEWAKKTQPDNIVHTIESVTGPMMEEKKDPAPGGK